MHDRPPGYIPACGVDWLLPLYDPFLRWVMREERFKRRLIDEARITAGQRVLDLGCGTGTLTILVKRLYPDADVCGLDGDPQALAIAARKAKRAGVALTLEQGLSYQLPYPAECFDRVLSSLMFHHLTRTDKLRSLHEVRRVLKAGGLLAIVDLGEPTTWWSTRMATLFHHREQTRDNLEGQLVNLLAEAGFLGVERCGQHSTVIGTLSFYRGTTRPISGQWADISQTHGTD
jgi:ubiquinone/menaquinone biosynthesis C-methylase UbiE